eukprot:2117003-Pleurochrysis_carterae.AAC.2
MLEAATAGAAPRNCAGRAAVAREKKVFYPLRLGGGATCAYNARTHEKVRRLVEECGCRSRRRPRRTRSC